MGQKKADTSDLPEINDKDLLDGLVEGVHAIVVGWSPGKSRLVNILSIKVNGERVALDVLDDDSPWVGKLPLPTKGRFKVSWALAPKVPLANLIIGIVNLETGNKTVVDKASDLARNQLWENNTGVAVDAP